VEFLVYNVVMTLVVLCATIDWTITVVKQVSIPNYCKNSILIALLRPAVSNGKKAFATNVATGASLSPHFFGNTLLQEIFFFAPFFHYD
jgi:hypothetical protein